MGRMSFVIARLIFVVAALLALFPPPNLRITSAQTHAVPNDQDLMRGIEFYKQGRYSEAAKQLKIVANKNKGDAQAWYYLGLALVHQEKEVKNSSKAFETALKLRPHFAEAHAGMAYSLLLRNKTSEAFSKAQQAISIDPTIADAHYIEGVALLRMGKREEALTAANDAIKLNPQLASPYLLKSQALVTFVSVPPLSTQQGREARLRWYSDAADALEKYLQLTKRSEDKELWNDQLEALRFVVKMQSKDAQPDFADTSEVTVKARVISKPEPKYTEEARRNQIVGTVILRAVFTANGKVNHILVIKSLPSGLTQKSVEAARRIKFIPAMLNGRPVSMFLQLEYNFNLY